MAAIIIKSFTRSLNSQLEEPVRQHLKNVYACQTMSSVAAAVGAYVCIYSQSLQSAGLLAVFTATTFLVALLATPTNSQNTQIRLCFLFVFAFFSGIGMGPLLQMAIANDPSIIVTSLVGSALIFVSFSLASLTARRGRWLYLGGPLMALTTVLGLSLANIFFGSQLIFGANLYIGFLVMCGFVLYDTQLIVEKCRCGDSDFVAHSVDLFIDLAGFVAHSVDLFIKDLAGIFRRIIITLLSERERRRSRRNDYEGD